MEWATRCDAAAAIVDAWIARVGTRWDEPRDHAWSDKDLLGHLSAWSDFLLDEVEDLLAGRVGRMPAVDVDAWNAEQVRLRRARTAGETIDEWRLAARRAAVVARSLSADARQREWYVEWSASPVTIDDLLSLWIAHVEQHCERLRVPRAR
jgi:hypothetical protein